MQDAGDKQVYFDNAATTFPKPEEVYGEVERFMREVGGSAGRSGHWRAVETGRVVFTTRQALAGMFNIGDPLRIAFTGNATEALNIAIQGLLQPGDHVVTSSVEHNSVMRPLTAAGDVGVTYSVARCAPDGTLDPAVLEKEITGRTALVVLNHASNVAGSVLPVADIATITRSRGIPFLLDAAQAAGRLPIDVESDGIDLLAFTGHKELFGPQGTGGLYIREGLRIDPLCYGGTGSRSSELEQPGHMPDKFESGTLNAVGIAGLGAGVRFIAERGIDGIRKHELELIERTIDGLAGIDGVTVLGPDDPADRVGILPLVFDRYSPAEAAEILDRRYGIASRAGMHCSPMAHRTIGTIDTGVTRLSFSYLNDVSEVDYLLECLSEMTTTS